MLRSCIIVSALLLMPGVDMMSFIIRERHVCVDHSKKLTVPVTPKIHVCFRGSQVVCTGSSKHQNKLTLSLSLQIREHQFRLKCQHFFSQQILKSITADSVNIDECISMRFGLRCSNTGYSRLFRNSIALFKWSLIFASVGLAVTWLIRDTNRAA